MGISTLCIYTNEFKMKQANIWDFLPTSAEPKINLLAFQNLLWPLSIEKDTNIIISKKIVTQIHSELWFRDSNAGINLQIPNSDHWIVLCCTCSHLKSFLEVGNLDFQMLKHFACYFILRYNNLYNQYHNKLLPEINICTTFSNRNGYILILNWCHPISCFKAATCYSDLVEYKDTYQKCQIISQS